MQSQIITTISIENVLQKTKQKLPYNQTRVIESDEFKVEHSKEAIREAYIASEKEKYIILVAKKFNIYAQNSLLKILEEPPKNIIFIIITNTKSSLLPTICSRLKITNLRENRNRDEFNDFNIRELNYQNSYEFLKKNQNISKEESKVLIESIFIKLSSELKLSEKELEIFSTSFKLIELNSRPINILTKIVLLILNKNNI